MSEFVVHEPDELKTLFNQGFQARTLGGSNVDASRHKSSAVFSINVYQKSAKQSMGVKAHFQIIDLAGVESGMLKDTSFCKGMSALLALFSKSADGKLKAKSPLYTDSKLTCLLQVCLHDILNLLNFHALSFILQDVIGGNCITHIVAAASPSENSFQDTHLCLQTMQHARGITNKVQVNLEDSDFLVTELREEISRLRDKMVDNVPSRDDVNKLEILVADLKYAKNQSWDEKIKVTAKLELERRSNLGNQVSLPLVGLPCAALIELVGLLQGLTEIVLNNKKSTKGFNERLVLIDKEKGQVSLEYQEKRESIDKLKEDLRKKITEYTKQAETGKPVVLVESLIQCQRSHSDSRTHHGFGSSSESLRNSPT